MQRDCFLIAQLSDLHGGSWCFDPERRSAGAQGVLEPGPGLAGTFTVTIRHA